MSESRINHMKTEHFVGDHLPSYFQISDPIHIDDALEEFMGRVNEIAGDRGSNDSVFDWTIADQLSESTVAQLEKRSVTETRSRHAAWAIEGEKRTLGNSINSSILGSLILVGAHGEIEVASSIPNPEVDTTYGDPTPYILEKLGWAKLIDVLDSRGADHGFGYEHLTEMLRSNGRITPNGKPHIGMTTLYDVPYSQDTTGDERIAIAYGSASNFTLGSSSVGMLLKNPRFFEIYKRDLNEGLFTNIADWLAGRLDTMVSKRGLELFHDHPITEEFPYLDTPAFIHVDNN